MHSDQQVEGVDFFEAFAPVASGTSVHLILMLSITLELAITNTLITQMQAPMHENVFTKLPKAFQVEKVMAISF